MARKILNGLDLASQRITNLADGSSANDAVTLQQLQNLSAGLDWKTSVAAASTANLTLSGTQTVDGVTLAAGQRILVKNQTDATQNGIYAVAAGAWTRTSDAVTGTLTSGAVVSVEAGTVNADTSWVMTTDGTITVGTTSQTWSTFAAGKTYTAGTGITVTGSVIAVAANTVHSYSATIGDGSATSIAVTHSLGTRDVIVRLYRTDTYAEEDTDMVHTDANTVTLTFAVAPSTGLYRVVVAG